LFLFSCTDPDKEAAPIDTKPIKSNDTSVPKVPEEVDLTPIKRKHKKAKGTIPLAAYKYRRMMIRIVQAESGLNPPLAMYAAQIHKESTWRPDVCSAFACGLTQFTDSTAKYVGEKFAELGPGNVMDPPWAIKAQTYYNQHLFSRSRGANNCDSWAKTLSAYNGGIGWLRRDEAEAEREGADRSLWWNNVEIHKDPRRRASAVKENTNYPIRILLELQLLYHQEGFVEGPLVCEHLLYQDLEPIK
jgi:soluble lytic murein transglycosylase-like protein